MTILARRIFLGISANLYGQLITICIQLLSVPLYLYYWGIEQYGHWVMLTAIPVYFAMADIGIVATATNKMAMLAAKKDTFTANVVFQSILVLILILTISLAVLSFFVIFSGLFFERWLLEKKILLFVLIFSTLTCLFGGVLDAVFRANERYALGVYCSSSVRLIEWLAGLIGLIYFGSMLSVALGMCLARVISTFLLFIYTKLKFKQYIWGWSQADFSEVRDLALPSVSFMAFPLGFAFSVQGITLLIGTLFGASYLAIFNTYRTLNRSAIQLLASINRSFWPEFSRLYAEDNILKMKELYKKGMFYGVLASTLVMLIISIMGYQLIDYWTHGKVVFIPELFYGLMLVSALTAFWQVGYILLVSTNQHIRLAYLFFVFSLALVVLGFFLGKVFGGIGVVLALGCFEIAMMILIHFLVVRFFAHWTEGR